MDARAKPAQNASGSQHPRNPPARLLDLQRIAREAQPHKLLAAFAEGSTGRKPDPGLVDQYQFYEGDGCIECGGTGFKGRTAICELMDLTDRIRDMILDRRPTSEIKRAAREEGMKFLRECAVGRVLDGVTTLREINKVTFVE